MYDNYSFVLNWDELPQELQDEKIDQYITKNYESEQREDAEGELMSLSEALEDLHIREDAAMSIAARFPMYF